MGMRNSLKEPEKINSIERNKMEIDREVKSPQGQFVEKLNNTLKPRNHAQAYDRRLDFEQDHRRRLAKLDIEDRKQLILTK